MFDFTEPIKSGSFLPGQNIFSIAFTSSGSPTCKNKKQVYSVNDRFQIEQVVNFKNTEN